ncbi:MAG: GIY-YIG nuclease family protein, partial [Candidatus Marinimicrobia bacterium]|nr:GIY-YIG nuclease family protein [Candidatus Neomarinimicrobiota bacterium]
VYYAETNDVWEAIKEEKRIKAGSRIKKVNMIESMNPSWVDLAALWYD